MIRWNDSLAIGIEEIDAQHRELVRRYNDFEEALADGSSEERVVGLLLFLREYAERHFDKEEAFMKKIGYPDLTGHALMHLSFVGKRFWLSSSVKEGGEGISEETAGYLRQWILNHIGVEDKKIGDYAAKLA